MKAIKKKLTYSISCLITGALLPISPMLADDDHDHDHDDRKICMGQAPAILEVADFDGNGIVNEDDIMIIKRAKKQDVYYAFYDINADGKFNSHDIRHAKSDLGKKSSILDQQKATLFHQLKQLQLIDNEPELRATRYVEIAPSLAGHGEHWTYALPSNSDNVYRPDGVNFSADDNTVRGIFWSQDAIPVFENGATDYPDPNGEWVTSRVVSFAGQPPKYTNSPDEKWHTHAGLCVTADVSPKGLVPVLHQHTSFAECQAFPSVVKTDGDYNVWFNIWMLHGWMFDLNPNGFFAGTHPCADPGSPSEHTINEGRTVPPFFQHHEG